MRRESRAERERRERRGARDTPGRESRDTVCLTVSLSSAVCLWQLRVGVSFSSNKAAGGDVRREEHGGVVVRRLHHPPVVAVLHRELLCARKRASTRFDLRALCKGEVLLDPAQLLASFGSSPATQRPLPEKCRGTQPPQLPSGKYPVA